ncbi:MAG: C4-dicarboxylate TRAP transporter substrate-binding protein [Heliomarina sp.]|uniref:C4-dicarboxylate TRAP transporter substrate-binding protein n=1 Tax=Heliomarina sp. TaxID=2917556 RepID=UPI0040589487|nr:ABC transporter substrate-binding protein [Paracoccaceae bacterium]
MNSIFSRTTAVAALLMAGSVSASAETVLRFSDYGPNRGTRAEALEWFAAELDKRTDGDLKIEFFWGGSLLGGRDTLSGVGDGVADLGTIIGFFTPKELQLYNIGDLPVENSDMWVGLNAMYDLSNSEMIAEEFSKAGVKYVTNYTTGPVQLICRSEVNTLDDLNGLKIRASGPYGDTLERLGAEIVRMSQADVYQALDSGLLDCNQNYYYAMQAYRQYEVAPYVLAMDWGQNMSFGIAINEMTYSGFSDENKEVFDKLSRDFIDHLAEQMEQTDEEALASMVSGGEGAGITVAELSEEDRDRLNEASAQSIDDWTARVSENGGDGEALLAEYQKLIEDYKAKQ